jgi:PAS domain S-box-containing protein
MRLAAFEFLTDAVVAVDATGVVLYTNPGARRLYALDGDAVGRPFAEMTTIAGAVHNADDLAFAKETEFRAACTHTNRHGEAQPVEWSLRWVSESDEPFYLSLAVRRTVALRGASGVNDRERLRAFMDALPDAALFVAPDLSIVVANQALANTFGTTPEALVGEDALARFPKELADARRQRFAQAVAERRPVRFEDERGGRHFISTISPMFDREQRYAGAAIVAFDVTELKEQHQRRLELEERFSHAQRLESIGRLAGGVAHDFNNLLTGMFGFVELTLMELDADDPVRENLEGIREAGEHAAELTRQLLAFSRRQLMSPRVLDVNAQVERARGLLCRVIGEDIKLECHTCSASALVHMDPTQFNQVLMNLATNARDAMPNGGTLVLETATTQVEEEFSRLHPGLETGPHVQLSVSDSGVGIAGKDTEKVFEPFYTTKSREHGTGLGLSTVHGIMSQNRGIITVYSVLGVGTTFKLYIPCADEDTVVRSSQSAAPVPKAAPGSTILLVEDEKLVRQVARRILERAGYTVLEATDGASALELHAAVPGITLVLTDVIMPDMNGKELASQLLVRQPELKCVFMSGYADDVIVHRGVLDPGVDFVEKPFTAQSLLARLDEVLGRED